MMTMTKQQLKNYSANYVVPYWRRQQQRDNNAYDDDDDDNV